MQIFKTHPLPEHIGIYCNTKVNLTTLTDQADNLRPFQITQGTLSESMFNNVDKISILIIDTLDELNCITLDLQHCIVIIAEHLHIVSAHLFNAIIYKRQADESHQDALEKVFHGLVRFCFSTELFIDEADIQQALAFRNSKYLNIACFLEHSLLDNQELSTLLSPITKDDALLINLSLSHTSYSTQKICAIVKQITDHITKNFDGDLFYSCIVSSEPEHQNLIYLNFTNN